MIDNKKNSVSCRITVYEFSDREIVETIIRQISHKNSIIEPIKDIFEGC